MPLYFFNFSRAPGTKSQPFKNEGLELVDNDAAWEEATIAAKSCARWTARSGLAPAGEWTLRTQTVRRSSLSDLPLNL
jgi:hypothetical protein